MGEFFRTIDTLVMGRKTWEVGRKLGAKSDPSRTTYVFSRRLRKAPDEGTTFVSEDPKSFAARLRARPGKDIWLMGGGELFGAFLDAGEVDAITFHVIPILIGEGIPVIDAAHRQVSLVLVGHETFPDGVVRLTYAPRRPARKK